MAVSPVVAGPILGYGDRGTELQGTVPAMLGLLLWLVASLIVLAGVVGPALGVWNAVRLSELQRRLQRLEEELRALRESQPHAPAPAEDAGTRPPTPAPATAPPSPAGVQPSSSAAPTSPAPAPSTLGPLGQPLVWAGGVALALAAILAAAYGVERGLLSPRLWLSGLALLGVAAFALALALHHRGERGALPQALAGAALVAVFAALYAAALLYGLLPPLWAAALAALAALATLTAGLLLGTPVLLLGALGGYGAPLLVGIEPLPPLPLFAHLGLVTLLVAAVARLRASPLLAWLPPLALTLWLPLATLLVFFSGAPAGAGVPADSLAWGIAVFGLLAGRPDLWASLMTATPPLLPIAQRLAHHLLHLVVAAFLLQGWVWSQPQLHPGLLAVILLQPALALLAAARGAGGGALVPVVLLALATVATTALSADRVEALLWADPAVGLNPPFWVPLEARPVLLTTALLVLAFALPGHRLAQRGQIPALAAAAAGLVPLGLLAVAYGRLAGLVGDLPLAFAALGWGGLAVLGVRDLLQRGQARAAGLEALAGVAAVATGTAFLLPTGQWPLALAAVTWGALALARSLGLAELRLAAGLAAMGGLLAALREALHIIAAESLGHLLLAYVLPGLLLATAARLGLAAGWPHLRRVLEAAAEGLLLLGLAALVLVVNGIAPTLDGSPLLRDGLALLLWLRFALLLTELRPHMPSAVRWLPLLPALVALLPLQGLVLGSSSPLHQPLDVGLLPLLDGPLVMALLPTVLAARLALALRRQGLADIAHIAGAAALAGLLWWIALEVRHLFRGPLLLGPWQAEEHLALSLAWTAVALILALLARRWRQPALRLAALAVALLVAVKLFLVDLAQLGGLVRIAALAGGGIGLLLLGWLTRPAAAGSADASE